MPSARTGSTCAKARLRYSSQTAMAATSWSFAFRPASGASWPRTELPRLVHAAAKTLDQPQGARRPALAVAAQDVADALLDALDQRLGLVADHQDELVELLEPAHLQKLVARHVEDEGGDADAGEFREQQREGRGQPVLM